MNGPDVLVVLFCLGAVGACFALLASIRIVRRFDFYESGPDVHLRPGETSNVQALGVLFPKALLVSIDVDPGQHVFPFGCDCLAGHRATVVTAKWEVGARVTSVEVYQGGF